MLFKKQLAYKYVCKGLILRPSCEISSLENFQIITNNLNVIGHLFPYNRDVRVLFSRHWRQWLCWMLVNYVTCVHGHSLLFGYYLSVPLLELSLQKWCINVDQILSMSITFRGGHIYVSLRKISYIFLVLPIWAKLSTTLNNCFTPDV